MSYWFRNQFYTFRINFSSFKKWNKTHT